MYSIIVKSNSQSFFKQELILHGIINLSFDISLPIIMTVLVAIRYGVVVESRHLQSFGFNIIIFSPILVVYT